MMLLIRGPFQQERLKMLRENLRTDWEVRVWDPGEGADAYAALMGAADATVAMRWHARMPAAPNLKLIQLPGAGLDEIDFAALPPQAAVCNVFEHEIGIAEYVLLAMLEWEIRLCRMDRHLRAGDWQDSLYVGAPTHGELFGKTVGIIGYGRIGREIARRARPFGLKVLARTRSPDKGDEHVDGIAGMDALASLLAEADYLIVACPLDDATRGLIGHEALRLMKRSAVLINVARGAIVDEDALFDACRHRTIAGAVIDTWYRYPRSNDEPFMPSRQPFHELDNVLMSPHASGWSAGLLPRRWRVIAGNLDRLSRGEPLLNLVRAPHGPAPG